MERSIIFYAVGAVFIVYHFITRQERDQQKRSQTQAEDDMLRRHHADKKRLPGILKREAATRQQMFKQSLRISMITSPEEEKEKVKQVGGVLITNSQSYGPILNLLVLLHFL